MIDMFQRREFTKPAVLFLSKINSRSIQFHIMFRLNHSVLGALQFDQRWRSCGSKFVFGDCVFKTGKRRMFYARSERSAHGKKTCPYRFRHLLQLLLLFVILIFNVSILYHLPDFLYTKSVRKIYYKKNVAKIVYTNA